MAANSSAHLTTPEEGSLVVNCAARTGHAMAGIWAIAHYCNGDVVAATVERKRYECKLEAQLRSILVAYKLIQKLTGEQNFEAFTIRTHYKRALQLIEGEICVGEEEDDDARDEEDEDDEFEGDDEYSITLMGEDAVAGLPQRIKDLIEKDKVLAGLPVTKKAAKSTAEAMEAAESFASTEAKNAVESATSEVMSGALAVEGANATKEAAGYANLEVASRVSNAEDKMRLDSTVSEQTIKDLFG